MNVIKYSLVFCENRSLLELFCYSIWGGLNFPECCCPKSFFHTKCPTMLLRGKLLWKHVIPQLNLVQLDAFHNTLKTNVFIKRCWLKIKIKLLMTEFMHDFVVYSSFLLLLLLPTLLTNRWKYLCWYFSKLSSMGNIFCSGNDFLL